MFALVYITLKSAWTVKLIIEFVFTFTACTCCYSMLYFSLLKIKVRSADMAPVHLVKGTILYKNYFLILEYTCM